MTACGAQDAVASQCEPQLCPAKLPPILTADFDFYDVAWTPKPHSLTGDAVANARLTSDTWRREITAHLFVEEPHTKVPALIENR